MSPGLLEVTFNFYSWVSKANERKAHKIQTYKLMN